MTDHPMTRKDYAAAFACYVMAILMALLMMQPEAFYELAFGVIGVTA